MREPTVTPRDPFSWLSAENQAKLATFKAYAVHHALLQDVDGRLMHAIAEPAGFAHVLVYGPSGVGKSTMLQQLHRRTAALVPHPAESRAPAARWSATPSDISSHPLLMLDWVKSMTNMSGVVHVLVGTYDLLNFRNLSGQAARRGYDIHFPRYQFQHDADRKAFQGVLLQLLHHQPLQADVQELLNHWYYFYERSIGCVGVLKDWLVRTVAAALHEDDHHLSLARVQAHALSNAQCESMAADAHAAEQKLHYTESSREHLWSLLGMSGLAAQPSASPGAISAT